jgi:hypothetical protein
MNRYYSVLILTLLMGCGGGGSPTGGSGKTDDLSRYVVTELGDIESHFEQLNDVGDVLAVRTGNELYRFHKGVWTKVAGNSDRIAGALSPTDSRYVALGVLYGEDGTPIPTPTGLPGGYQSGNKGLVVFVEAVVGEWAYGYTLPSPGSLTLGQPFRWKINGGQIEPRGEFGDFAYKSVSQQFVSRVTGDANGRILLQTTPGNVMDGVFLSYIKVIEPDGTRYDLNELLGAGFAPYKQVYAEIAEDGTILGSAHPGASIASGAKTFSFSRGAFKMGPSGRLGTIPNGTYQSGEFFFADPSDKSFTWSPTAGAKNVPGSPMKDARLAKRNRRGQWLISKNGGSAAKLLTPK